MKTDTAITKGFDSLPDSSLVSAKTVAALFEVHRNTVRRWVSIGQLPPPIKITKQTDRWPVGVIRNRLANRKQS